MKEEQKILRFIDLGLIDYEQAWALQKDQVAKCLQEDQDAVFLCEHPAVITLGRLAKRENLLLRDEISNKGIKVIDIDRGGDVTLHSPGQLVIYPVLDLRKKGKNLRSYLEKLEQVAIDFFKEFDILTERKQGKTGVWFRDNKIASIGVGVKKWISYHGMSLNINTDLTLFSLIRPCGLNVRMTSLAEIKQGAMDLDVAKTALKKTFNKIFMGEKANV